MMHEHGKSDSAIVAAKPTNKAGRPAAEPVERRAGTPSCRQRASRTFGATRTTKVDDPITIEKVSLDAI